MTESELAFNANGEPFDLPETATGWRVRRLRGGRGAPELVYGRDGRPLTLGIDAGMDELRDAVETSGRYRLDAVDDDGKVIPNVPPSYVQVTVAERNSSTPEAAGPPVVLSSTDLAVRELVRANVELARQNTELARTVATQQPDLVKAAAEILRAADGAGLPRREPMGDWYEDQEESDELEPAPRPVFDIGTLMGQLVPVIARLTGMDAGKVGVLFGSGQAVPAASTSAVSASAPKQLPSKSRPRKTDAANAPRAPEPDEAQTDDVTTQPVFVASDPISHFMAIQAQLTPEERTYVQSVINKLDVVALTQWRDQLARMAVDEAVTVIRGEIEKHKENVS